jgi:membrane associated rhomboid family serine protease
MPRAPYSDGPTMTLPRPGPALRVVLLVMVSIWLAFAVGINWGGAPESLFYALCGNTRLILSGEIWRLFTAPLLHVPSGTIGHILTTMLGLYFLGTSLESSWGGRRFLGFLAASALFAYVTQMLVEIAMPANIASKLVGEYWFGAVPVISAISIAWALSFRGRTVNLMLVFPVSSRGLILFVLILNVMYLLAGAGGPDGLISPFGGMLAGFLFGGGTPSPVRKLWLKLRLAQLDAEARREASERKQRIARGGFKAIDGGRGTEDSDERDSRKGPDGGWLN